jgi:hypothetical protein
MKLELSDPETDPDGHGSLDKCFDELPSGVAGQQRAEFLHTNFQVSRSTQCKEDNLTASRQVM